MEFFKTDVLKKEFERFEKEILLNMLDQNLCQKSSCQYHHRFLLNCSQCRKEWCKPCKIFDCAKQTLLQNLDKDGKAYVESFISDFLNLSDESFSKFYNKTRPISIPRPKTFDVKSFHKRYKNRSQVNYKNSDNCKKLNYQIKGLRDNCPPENFPLKNFPPENSHL